MKKLLLIVLLLVGCENIGGFNHDHHKNHGGCIERENNATDTYTCYSAWTQKHCLTKELSNNENSDNEVHMWISDMTCEEFCALPSSYICSVDDTEF